MNRFDLWGKTLSTSAIDTGGLPWYLFGEPAGRPEGRKDVFSMRLRSEADVQKFLEAVNACQGDVYLKSPQGDVFNLKSAMSQYVAVGRLIEEQGSSLELFADRQEDQARLMPVVEDLIEKNGD